MQRRCSGAAPHTPRRGGCPPVKDPTEAPMEEADNHEGLYEGLGDFPRAEFHTQYDPSQLKPFKETETTQELDRAKALLE
ncbi:uncharacterized protein A4U43_C02F10620 [Asparagus officinalis]|uniref:Uncharacterized protein n=1 Tax=Asparagus officinalis TaxID=4686 RepID=A0A5P1FHI7_ASPOF|nr:uncharacterized protein A4U43_C02F10620 [Asparagus officinalis]